MINISPVVPGPRRHFEVGGPILKQNFENFQKMGTYLVNPNIFLGAWPPGPPPPPKRPLIVQKQTENG